MAGHVLYRCPPCIMCKRSDTVCLDAAQLAAYNSGTLIDAAFPGMDADRRELIKTGIHPECWDRIFPDEEPFDGVEVCPL